MCLLKLPVSGLNFWNWDGDIIIHDPIVPSSRPVVNSRNKKNYDIDVREFLVSDKNSVMGKTLNEDIIEYIRTIPGGRPDVFLSQQRYAFDYKAKIIAGFVAEKIKYHAKKGNDPWLFPDETLFLKMGDCEDRALLIASLLAASGISSYNIRVVLGRLNSISKDNITTIHDHAWVMYKNEDGLWTLLEPLNIRDKGYKHELKSIPDNSVQPEKFDYEPFFLFNQHHLWAVNRQGTDSHTFEDYMNRREKWNKFHPKFWGAVHQSIINDALKGANQWFIQTLNGYFDSAVHIGFIKVGPTVDDIDADTKHYTPLEHFDNCFIDESWDLVNQRLAEFKSDSHIHIDSFARAAHAIADFYSHTSYGHFAKFDSNNPNLFKLYDKNNPDLNKIPDYSHNSDFDLVGGKFSINGNIWKLPRTEIAEIWNGKLISGRYAQDNDTHSGLINQLFEEGPSHIPGNLIDANFYKRGGVPHHNQIAVDSDTKSTDHILYLDKTNSPTDRLLYSNQFNWRKQTAISHIKKAFWDNLKK